MSDGRAEKAPLPKRSARNGFIEILQVVSLILFGVALLLPEVRVLAVCIALVLFVVPFLLVKPQSEPAAAPDAGQSNAVAPKQESSSVARTEIPVKAGS